MEKSIIALVNLMQSMKYYLNKATAALKLPFLNLELGLSFWVIPYMEEGDTINPDPNNFAFGKKSI